MPTMPTMTSRDHSRPLTTTHDDSLRITTIAEDIADVNPQFTVISDEDQALLDSFFAGPDSLADDYSDLFGSGMASQTYGLAPQIVSGDISRLPLPGIGQPGYSNEAVSSYGAVSLSCSLGYLEEPFRSRFVALSPAMMNAGFSCGRCIRLQCDDTSCAEAGKQIVAQVVDRSGELFDGDVTLSGALFKELTGRDFGRNPSISVSWAFESCSPWIETPVKMLVKPGGSAYYQAVSFSNSREPILAVMINGERLTHEQNNYWSWNPRKPINPRAGFDIALLGANKQVLRARIQTLRSSDLGIQFAGLGDEWDAARESRNNGE
jgi:hypothetical protein